MNVARYQFLRWLFISVGIIHLVAVGIAYTLYSHTFKSGTLNPITTPFSWWSSLVMTVILIGLGVILAIVLKRPSYHLFLAAFLISFGSTYTYLQAWGWTSDSDLLPSAVHVTVTGALFIYSMLRFAGYRRSEAYQHYFNQHKRPAFYKNIVTFFAKDKPFWFVLVPILLVLSILSRLISSSMVLVLNILILFIGLIYFRISYSFSGKENQGRLAWLLWGLISCIVLYIIGLFLRLLYPDLIYVHLADYILTCLVICFSFIMSIFFSGSTDAHIVVRKTLIYSVLFLTGLFIFGVLEHFVVHIIAHSLHLENSILNSCLGAAIALLIRPLHHKVEHWLEKWEKNKKAKVEHAKQLRVQK